MERSYVNTKATDTYRSLLNNLSDMPFSFIYDGTEYKGFSSEHFTYIDDTVVKAENKETHHIRFKWDEDSCLV